MTREPSSALACRPPTSTRPVGVMTSTGPSNANRVVAPHRPSLPVASVPMLSSCVLHAQSRKSSGRSSTTSLGPAGAAAHERCSGGAADGPSAVRPTVRCPAGGDTAGAVRVAVRCTERDLTTAPGRVGRTDDRRRPPVRGRSPRSRRRGEAVDGPVSAGPPTVPRTEGLFDDVVVVAAWCLCVDADAYLMTTARAVVQRQFRGRRGVRATRVRPPVRPRCDRPRGGQRTSGPHPGPTPMRRPPADGSPRRSTSEPVRRRERPVTAR